MSVNLQYVVKPEPPEPLDRCDMCPQKALVSVAVRPMLASGEYGRLVFCAHHWHYVLEHTSLPECIIGVTDQTPEFLR